MTNKPKPILNSRTFLWTLFFVAGTAGALAASGRTDLVTLGALMGLIFAAVWRQFVLFPNEIEKELGAERIELNLETQGLKRSQLKKNRSVFASAFFVVWLITVIPPLTPQARQLYDWVERHVRSEQVILRLEYPSYLDTPAREIRIKGNMTNEVEVDSDAYLSVSVRYRKSDTMWSFSFQPAHPTQRAQSQMKSGAAQLLSSSGNIGHSARSLLEQHSLEPGQDHTLILFVSKNGSEFGKQTLKITPQPRPLVEINRAREGQEREGVVSLDVRARSKIPLTTVEFHVRTASGYRMVKAIAEFANANEENFQGKQIPFQTTGIPFAPKDTLYIKAVAKTVAENIFGESEELSFEIVTRESIRQDLIQSLEKSLAALQDKSLSTQSLKENLEKELKKARESAQQMGSQSAAAKQTEQISQLADKISRTGDSAAQQTEKKIKNLLERLKREQTSNQMQNLFARLQNLKMTIQRTTPDQLDQLSKDARELKSAAENLKEQLQAMIDKPKSGLTPQEKQQAHEALKQDQTPENLTNLEKTLQDKNQTTATNQSQTTLEHAQKNLGNVFSLLQQARQRAIRDAREKLTRADNDLQNARRDLKNSKGSLDKAQKDLDSLPDISEEFQEGAKSAQKGNSKARQGQQYGDEKQFESGLNEAQDGIVQALAALQDEEESERQSQQEQDAQNLRNSQEALAAQSQLDMGWRRRILEEIARLRQAGESSDSPAIQYLESRLR